MEPLLIITTITTIASFILALISGYMIGSLTTRVGDKKLYDRIRAIERFLLPQLGSPMPGSGRWITDDHPVAPNPPVSAATNNQSNSRSRTPTSVVMKFPTPDEVRKDREEQTMEDYLASWENRDKDSGTFVL